MSTNIEAITNISNYTNKDRFSSLMSSINNDITTQSQSSILINNTAFSLTGSPIKGASTNSGIAPLDLIGNKIADGKSVFSSTVNSAQDALGLTATNPGRPEVINLSADGPINTANLNAKMITDYLPPTNIAMSSFQKLGKSFDDMIKDNLIVQTFHLKGTDILCTTLCLLMSLLPCQITNKIVDDIQAIKDMQTAVNNGMSMAASSESFALSNINSSFSGGISGLANVKDLGKSLSTAFNKTPGATPAQVAAQDIKAVVSTFSTVVQVLNLLISVAKLGFMNPMALLGYLVNGMFDLLENVLLALQAMAVQMADKIMNKVIAPIEKFFKKNTFPALCGLGAQLIFKKILQVIYDFKNKILAFIADLFAFQKSARKKFQLFNSNMLWTLELSAILKVLELILGNFMDIILSCGVVKRPCGGDNSGPNLSENFTNDPAFNQDNVALSSSPVAKAISNTEPPPPGTLNDMAIKLQPMINSIFPGSTNIVTSGQVATSMPNLPPLIASLLGSIDLGPNLSVYMNNNNATVVYNNKSLCGAN